jgi:hypothetical protein
MMYIHDHRHDSKMINRIRIDIRDVRFFFSFQDAHAIKHAFIVIYSILPQIDRAEMLAKNKYVDIILKK